MNEIEPPTPLASTSQFFFGLEPIQGWGGFVGDTDLEGWSPGHDTFRKVAKTWQAECDRWATCRAKLDCLVTPSYAWTPSSALESAERGMPEGGLDALLYDRVRSAGGFTCGGLLVPDRWKSEPDTEYGVGVAFLHDSTECGVMLMQAFVFRRICMNGLIWGGHATEATIEFGRHEAPDAVASMVRDRLGEVLNGGEHLMLALRAAKNLVVFDPVAFLQRESSALGEQTGIDPGLLALRWRAGVGSTLLEQGAPSEDSLFVIVNGLTRAAQQFDARQRWLLEAYAGNLVMGGNGSRNWPFSERFGERRKRRRGNTASTALRSA